MKRSDEIGRLVVELEGATERARSLGLDVAAYLLELTTSEVREAYVIQRYDEVPARPAARTARRNEMAGGG
ncbi:hypothetical protein [Phreatobacter cathodiphilus]|uniref:Uncharacterized protein n=1 Tax=Phreatobacter cathodiphilus TaxID=1868589 RepID=A0A2S0NFC3_9HYPH|nr:hypothetical protein [Phreatobacter cathodiphilus]AVO46855.1 hypothetical protein C6569_18310 [Phreatobacter cathodiphilus]